MTATLSKSQADLPRLVEIASQGEDVVITVGGKPMARLTRAETGHGNDMPPKRPVDLMVRIRELATLREKYNTGQTGRTIEQILDENRADRS